MTEDVLDLSDIDKALAEYDELVEQYEMQRLQELAKCYKKQAQR